VIENRVPDFPPTLPEVRRWWLSRVYNEGSLQQRPLLHVTSHAVADVVGKRDTTLYHPPGSGGAGAGADSAEMW
jgi:hypothetical protein